MPQFQEKTAAGASAPLRVLQVISTLNPDSGGPAEGAVQLCAALARSSHEADAVTLDVPGAGANAQYLGAVFPLGPRRLGRFGYNERLHGWLSTNARRYDAVIVHGLWQYHGLATWRALRGTRTPYYVYPHGMLDPWFKRRYPLKHFKKSLYWPVAERNVLRDARAVLFTCEEERRLARASFSDYRANDVVVGYGIAGPDGDGAAPREAFLQRHPELRGKRVLLFLGRVTPKKGCDLLLEAFADVARTDPTLHLVMAGPHDDGYQAELAKRAQVLRLTSRLSWTGMLNGDLKWGAFRCADAFVLPSHQENFGIAVVEALACRVPVLISNQVNIWREIAAAQAGFVADDSLRGTRELLHQWLALTPRGRDQMGANGLACYRRHFHVDSMLSNLLATIGPQPCAPLHICAA